MENKPVLIIVGAEEKQFEVPKRLLCARSRFFEAACSERWTTDGSKPIRLPDDDPAAFSIYKAVLRTNDFSVAENERVPTEDSQWLKLMQAWVLADKIGDIKTANRIMDDAVRFLQSYASVKPGATVFKYVWDNTPNSTSPLRKLLTCYSYYHMYQHEYHDLLTEMIDTPDFLRDALIEFVNVRLHTPCPSYFRDHYRAGTFHVQELPEIVPSVMQRSSHENTTETDELCVYERLLRSIKVIDLAPSEENSSETEESYDDTVERLCRKTGRFMRWSDSQPDRAQAQLNAPTSRPKYTGTYQDECRLILRSTVYPMYHCVVARQPTGIAGTLHGPELYAILQHTCGELLRPTTPSRVHVLVFTPPEKGSMAMRIVASVYNGPSDWDTYIVTSTFARCVTAVLSKLD